MMLMRTAGTTRGMVTNSTTSCTMQEALHFCQEMVSFLATVSADSIANLVVPTFYAALRSAWLLPPTSSNHKVKNLSRAF